ncbi:MAG: hypothetical protein R3362_03695 [Rhodothermales bacterium]|nr:hypothetical protein [Rhodothermales bacterium]
MRTHALLLLVSLPLAVVAGGSAGAQPLPEPLPVAPDTLQYGTGIGASLLLTNYGFGIGLLLRGELSEANSAVTEVRIGAGKDEREQEFFVGAFGDSIVPLKRSYFVMLPLHVGLERRLFRETIEDNFRPFVQVLGGPTFGYQWPYFDDEDGDGIRDSGEERLGAFGGFADGSFRFGLGAALAVGAYFGSSPRATQGLRIGYTAHYFFDDVELLEPNPEVERPNQRYFGTPIVSLHLLRLF